MFASFLSEFFLSASAVWNAGDGSGPGGVLR